MNQEVNRETFFLSSFLLFFTITSRYLLHVVCRFKIRPKIKVFVNKLIDTKKIYFTEVVDLEDRTWMEVAEHRVLWQTFY
jgi:hypothetical protein